MSMISAYNSSCSPLANDDSRKAQLKQKIESDAEMTEERKSFWTDYITESEKKASDLLFQFVDSPDVLLNLIKILRSRKEACYSENIPH